MKNNIKTVLISLLLALVLFGGLLAVQSHVLSKYEQTEVVVAKRDIQEGTDLTQSNVGEYFEIRKVAKSLSVGSSVKNLEELYGQYTGVSLGKGSLAYKEQFRKASKETKNLTEPVEVSIALSNFSDGVSGTLRKGDYVYVYFVDRENGKAEMFGADPVYIKQSFNSSGEPLAVSDKQTAASVFSLVIERSMDADFCEAAKTKDAMLIRVGKAGRL